MKTMNQKKSIFQVDLSGILKILSDHLYSKKEVFLRELIQNSMDAIMARTQIESFEPSITIEYFAEDASAGLIIHDNGVGLTKDEVEDFLAKIGSSSKSGAIEKLRGDFIGQFGIGLLSCFMVSDEITVLTKSAKDHKSTKWVGKIDGTYVTEDAETEQSIGTKVILKLRQKDRLTEEMLIHYLKDYTEFLAQPIHLEINGKSQDSFQKLFPWELSGDQILTAGQAIFNEPFQNYVEIKNRLNQTIGHAYILPRSASHVQHQYGRIYIKRMFITENCDDILPEWAFFTRILINSESLSPTASREGIYLDANSAELKENIERCIKAYLISLSENTPEVLIRIIQIHNAAMKQMALTEESFLKFIYEWIPLPTSEGNMTLHEIKKKVKTVYHVPDVDEYRQVLPIANANNQLIINSGYVYDAELLEAINNIDLSRDYIKIDSAYFGNTLEDLSIEESDLYEIRIKTLGKFLENFGCRLDIKKFQPDSIPALYHANQNLMLSRDIESIQEESDDLWASVSKNIFETSPQQTSILFLNIENKTIKSLLENENATLDEIIIQVIYTNAMLMGHYPLNKDELKAVDLNLHQLIGHALNKK
jgi:molecular chaperone HtpG